MVVQAMGELLGFEKVFVGKVKQNENNLDIVTGKQIGRAHV